MQHVLEEEVTNIRLQSDMRENARRIDEEKKKAEYIAKKEAEKLASDEYNATIGNRWAGIMERSIPEELVSVSITLTHAHLRLYVLVHARACMCD